MKRIDKSAQNIFFTSDTHFGHESLMEFNRRPFLDALEMDQRLIKNWNDCVPADGLVFVLGDIGETDDDRILEIFEQLNGTKILVRGNHDVIYNDSILNQLFHEIHEILEVEIYDDIEAKYQEIVLCHYPLFDWNNFYGGAWQLFGHLHTRDIPEFKTLNARLFAQQYDVGIDGNNFRPISYFEVKKIITEQMLKENFKQSNYY